MTGKWVALEVFASAADEIENDIDRLVAQKAITIMCNVVRGGADDGSGET